MIGGSAGIGLETARRARAEGADVILTGRNPERLEHAARELGALSTAAFDATDPAALERFFSDLPEPIDHVMVTAGGPHYGPLLEMDSDQVRQRAQRPRGAGARGRAQRRRQDAARRHAAVHGRHRRPARRSRPRDRLRGHRRAAAVHRRPRARARAGPRQPHRRRLRRHPVVGIAARRRARGAPRRAARRRSRSAASSAPPTSPRSRSTS